MQALDPAVIEKSIAWLKQGRIVWLCTVLKTYGSSPRVPGAMLAVTEDGSSYGSLSGGCIEEHLIDQLVKGEFTAPVAVTQYGDQPDHAEQFNLPCGGVMQILLERLLPQPSSLAGLERISAAYGLDQPLIKIINVESLQVSFIDESQVGMPAAPQTSCQDTAVDSAATSNFVRLRFGPPARLIVAGISPVASFCIDFAKALGFDVVVCDPRPEVSEQLQQFQGVKAVSVLPALFIAEPGNCHSATAVVALTHDPRLDDLSMMAAVKTNAFYIGAMGSTQTSRNRAQRLQRSGGLSEAEISRIHMPIGLDIGSKTPAEIALAVIADVVKSLNTIKANRSTN